MCEDLFEKVKPLLAAIPEEVYAGNAYLSELRVNQDMITTRTFWIVGGDGWAYDIGYNGIDHIISTTDNFNIMILDNELYSNTGGQASKSTQMGSSVKFTLGGKRTFKKDIAKLAMTYGHVYVAQIALGANYNQAIQAITEAESYDGPSLIVALSPCIDWNLKDPTQMMNIQRDAVEGGYWNLFRYDPRKGDNAFQLDSKKLKSHTQEFLKKQIRFDKLVSNKEWLDVLWRHLKKKNEQFQWLGMSDYEKLDFLKKKLGETSADGSAGSSALVLFGSETGNAQSVAHGLAKDLKTRGYARTRISAMDDYDFDSLPSEKKVFAVISTAGQGEFPSNSRAFWKAFTDTKLPADHLKNVEFAVFGLGDSSYVHYNKAAKSVDGRFAKLGAKRILPIGLGNEQDEERYETGLEDWSTNLYGEIGLKAPSDQLPPASFTFTASKQPSEPQVFVPKNAQIFTLAENRPLTRAGYERDIRHYSVDIAGKNIKYAVGDCLAIYPQNNEAQVLDFLARARVNPDQAVEVQAAPQAQTKLPALLSYRQLFTQVSDLLGKPNRRFLQFMSQCAQKPAEKKELKHLVTKEGKAQLKQLMAESLTYKDLLLRYPSAMPAMNYLAEFIPQIKPRLYSIASAQSKVQNAIDLCIIRNDWKTPAGKQRTGLNTSYLMTQQPGAQIVGCLHKGAINMPAHDVPVVAIGVGTGIAPIRALLQDREVAKKSGAQVAPMAFFFGARKETEEFLYKEEIQQWQQDGVLTLFDPAWSRDQKNKVYVQDKLGSNADAVFDLLYTRKGSFYLCGSAGKIPAAAKQAVTQIIAQKAGISRASAEQFVTQMQLEGKWNLDVW